MVPFQIKICGVTTVKDARHACESGADAIGLNFYKKSARFVSQEAAIEIANAIRNWSQGNRKVAVVGVFVNEPVSSLSQLATNVGLDIVQLHGDELPADVAKIRQTIGQDSGVMVLRAIWTQPSNNKNNEGPNATGVNLADEMIRVEAEVQRWANVSVEAVLLDAAIDGEFGGTGKSVDWSAVSKLKSAVPVILAGGLTAENVADAIRISKTQSVDVASGVESAPGTKDDELVRRFIQAAKSALS